VASAAHSDLPETPGTCRASGQDNMFFFISGECLMGSAGGKPRKRRHPLVPKYEEPNDPFHSGIYGGGDQGYGRFGHGRDRRQSRSLGRAGAFLLRLLLSGSKK
jgi:hypothetical protein